MKKILSSFLIIFIFFINLITPIFVFAATPIITLSMYKEDLNTVNGLVSWTLDINTKNIPDDKNVSIKLYENGTDITKVYTPVKITGNNGTYETQHILKQATKYKVTAFYGTDSGSFEKTTMGTAATEVIDGKTWWYNNLDKNWVGLNGTRKLSGFPNLSDCEGAKTKYIANNNWNLNPCFSATDAEALQEFELEKKVSAKIPGKEDPVAISNINEVENKDIYHFLAPLPGLKCMDNTGADKSCVSNDLGAFLNIIFKLGIGIAAALAVVLLIINGITYMGDESIFSKTEAKKKMFSAVLGLFIALGAWALLNTINPDLTGKNGLAIDGVNINLTIEENLSFFDARNVTGLNYGDDLFLGYMAHQQGAGGIKTIITAAQNGTNVPDNIMTNMSNNFPTKDAEDTLGTSELTPSNFLQYWSKKLAAARQSTVTVYGEIDTALTQASQDTGVDKSILVAMCRIESAKHCSAKESISSVNGSYSGLFQIGKDVWNKYKRSADTNIFDPYANARVAALYFKDNLKIVKS